MLAFRQLTQESDSGYGGRGANEGYPITTENPFQLVFLMAHPPVPLRRQPQDQ
jgi:hypothetical protein